MQRILVPLDGSSLATQIMPYVQKLATLYDAEVVLLHVVSEATRQKLLNEHPDLTWTTNEAPLVGDVAEGTHERDERMFPSLRKVALNYLLPIAQQLRDSGLQTSIETEVIFGAPEGCIVETARKDNATMIVMATHGYSGVRRWALGSVTERVLQSTTVPVFVVRATNDQPAADALTFRRLLVPQDGSETAKQALPTAIELAQRTGAALHLLSVVEKRDAMPGIALTYLNPDKLKEAQSRHTQFATEQLQQIAAEVQQHNLTVTHEVVVGAPDTMIIEQAVQQQCDAIVMATHGYGDLNRLLIGSVADKVIRGTATPMLIVRASTT